MIITKTPYRMSFFGGGTDYPAWFNQHGGKVLATTFDKYCYISLRKLPPFFAHKYRIVYSLIESVDKVDAIQHPSVREVLKYYKSKEGLEIHHDGDLPARSGLGSSSSFTVGLLNAMNAFTGKNSSSIELAKKAIHIEQDLIKESVGSQDQISAAYGGFNKINFYKDGTFAVEPLITNPDRLEDFNDHLMLFFTGVSRLSTEITKSQIMNIDNCYSQLKEMYEMVDEASSILTNVNTPLGDFGKLLHKSWLVKRGLSKKITNTMIDDLYNAALKAGALGGKVLGAGGGGFVLFMVKPENQDRVKKALSNLIFVPFKFENTGSKIVVYQPNGF
ncbi:MAG: kinase [SAR202 cluster bacterium]|nr:kinase [SAR202 cluster bacterium]|tara:strand:+ start:3034 stop:4029 length:996 start_codon:yes stop_codon:yes gene_type:complete